ncbi:MAG: SIS domain-containing protein [candidate division KSB1 bacterium]|nr:SIS domain-containing protein [candidate division KSB1 bacterium]
MKQNDPRYSQFHLVQEMTDVVQVVKNFDPRRTQAVAEKIRAAGRLLLTGEGSSRIFPAKNAVRKSLRWGLETAVFTEGSRQAAEYNLQNFAVFCASNSGRTKEVVLLAQKLAQKGNPYRFGLTANQGTPLEKACTETFVLTCGWEQATAATKSVIEQALFYESILRHIGKRTSVDYGSLAAAIETALTMPVPAEVVAKAVKAPTIYFSGYNDGVAEELTLKTNEITRRKSDFLEGTYAVHGIEEVMDAEDIVFVVDPIEEEMEKFHEVLVKGVGMTVVAISTKPTPFPTLLVPDQGEMTPYVYLAAGWNLLVEIGLMLGINLDKPERARKVGNELKGN